VSWKKKTASMLAGYTGKTREDFDKLRPQLAAEEFDFVEELAELFVQNALVGFGVRMFHLAAGFADTQLETLDLSGHFPFGMLKFDQHPLHVLAPRP